jgi:hypothetical protein
VKRDERREIRWRKTNQTTNGNQRTPPTSATPKAGAMSPQRAVESVPVNGFHILASKDRRPGLQRRIPHPSGGPGGSTVLIWAGFRLSRVPCRCLLRFTWRLAAGGWNVGGEAAMGHGGHGRPPILSSSCR